jgi:ATP-dependent DNA ligase
MCLGSGSDVAEAITCQVIAAIDVLVLDDEPVMHLPLHERRALLEALGLCGPAWCAVSSFAGLGPELMLTCAELGREGVVAKRLDSHYRPGERSRDWIKVKCPAWRADHAPRRLDPARRGASALR